ncbi:hypothetical protein LIER_33777 [Lithospermum erythrorhizon]|uniref:Integrase zinc-binding domain-containing protein n=1 Tax=Lithospermum erythrorhizon TaxID=34254 RepID=A0AAV3RYI6_LITER
MIEDWRSPIIKFLTTGELPKEKIEARKLQNMSYKFQIFQEELYKILQPGLLMYCVPKDMIRYYWPTLMNDSLKYVKRCDSCQKMKFVPKQLMAEMTQTFYPIPFAKWGIDLVKQFAKPSTKFKDAVVDVDYFSKWVEAIPLRNTTVEDIEDFIWKNIITRYGIPKILQTKEAGKINPKWEGPYRVRRVIGPGTYELLELSSRVIKHTWHEIYLKKYYI